MDLLRAQELLQQRAGLVAEDYVLHLVQWGWLQGGRELTLELLPGGCQWELPGAQPQPEILLAVSQGEFRLGDLELSTVYLMHCLALTQASEIHVESGNLLLSWRSGQWQTRSRPTSGPLRLRLKRSWMQAVKTSLLGRWRNLPELERLQQRLRGSSLHWTPPRGLQAKQVQPLNWMMRVEGGHPISQEPPLPADKVERLTCDPAGASLWFSPQGSHHEVVSQGLSYCLEPDFPGTLWLSLGDLPTDLSRRQLVLDDRFYQRREKALQQMLSSLDGLSEDRRDELTAWQWTCLLQPRLPATLTGWLLRKPLLPSFFHGKVSLYQLDDAVAEIGACLYADPDQSVRFTQPDFPLILVTQSRDGWLEWLSSRYRNVEEAGPVLQRCRLRARRIPMQQRALKTRFQRAIQWGSWQGRVGFEPGNPGSRLELGRQGELLGVLERGAAPSGFQFILEHPEVEWNPLDERPEGPLLRELRQWVNGQLIGWAIEACREVEPEKLNESVLELLKIPELSLWAARDIPLWGKGFTLNRLLEDARRGDLRDWIEAGIDLNGPPKLYLHRCLEPEQMLLLWEASDGYARFWSTWRAQLEQTPQKTAPQPPSLRVVEESPTPGIILQRQGCVIFRTPLSEELQGTELELWADHPEFRLNPDASGIDKECAGMAWFDGEAPRFLTQYLTEKIQGTEQAGVEKLLSLYPVRLWPRHVVLAQSLDGGVVMVGDLMVALQGRNDCSVLVEPVASRPLPGFEKSWLLTRAQRQKIQKLFPKLRLRNDTEAYNKAYASQRPETVQSESSNPPDIDHWLCVATLKQGSFEARAGLELVPGSLDHCPTLFLRDGRAAMQARLQLAPRSELTCAYRLVCQVDWPELPFCEDYAQFSSLLEIQCLLLWLRRFGVGSEAPIAYTLARLEMEAQTLPVAEWKDRPDGVREHLWSAPFLTDARGKKWSLQGLHQRADCIYSLTKVCQEPDAFLLEETTLEWLRRWLPEVNWRSAHEPSPRQLALDQLLQRPRAPLQLKKDHYLAMGFDGPFGCHWGILPPDQQPGSLQVWYQGRKLEAIRLDWPFSARVALPLKELELDARGQLRLEGELSQPLQSIRTWLEGKLEEPGVREQYLLYWLSLDTRPPEAEDGLAQPLWKDPWGRSWSLLEWSKSGPRPRPCLREGLTMPVDFPPQPMLSLSPRQIELATKLKLAEDFSEDLMEIEATLEKAPHFEPPESDFALAGPGFRLFSSKQWNLSSTLTTLTGRTLEEETHGYFPPYILELQAQARLPLSRPELPLEAFDQLGRWWQEQLQQPLADLGWLASFDQALGEAEPWEGAEDLLWLARRRLQEWFSQQLGDWELLESCLEHCLSGPWQLRLAEDGPPMEIQEGPQGITLYIFPDHPWLLHRTSRERVAYWVTRVCMELEGKAPACEVLARF